MHCGLGSLAALTLVLYGGSARADDAQERPPADRPAESESHHALRIGALAGVGFPRPLAFEAMIKLGDTLGLGAEYGLLPQVDLGGVRTSMWSLAGDARIFPFRGAFFVGLRAGRQHVDANTTITVAPYGSATEALALDSFFLNPRLGFLWTWDEGFTLGIDAGVQIPVAVSTTSSLPIALVPGASHTVDSVGGALLPTVDLLRIGMLF